MDETRFSDIADDLVENILMRLSMKYLKRLSCVNKWWYSLIHNPYFISRHYSYHSSFNVKLLVKFNELFDGPHPTTRDYVISILSENDGDCSHQQLSPIPFLNQNHYNIRILDPCINGIICLRIFTNEPCQDIALWNVATGEHNILPKLDLCIPPKSHIVPSMLGLGFGWVPDTNEFKVVTVIYYLHNVNRHPEVFVYTLSTNSWKKLSFEPPFESRSLYSETYVNGVCYWVNSISLKIISFHLRDEVFGSLSLPDLETPNHDDVFYLILHALDGCLALIKCRSDVINSQFDIWVLEESWIKKYTIGDLLNIDRGIRIVKDELFLQEKNGQLLSINVNSHNIKKIGIQGQRYLFQVLEYVESLVPIKRRL